MMDLITECTITAIKSLLGVLFLGFGMGGALSIYFLVKKWFWEWRNYAKVGKHVRGTDNQSKEDNP